MEIHFEINNQCLLKCRHCSSSASVQGEKMKYSERDMIQFLKNIEGKKDVFLTGGEPLLYPNLEKLLNNLQMQISDLDLGMFTSGIVRNLDKTGAISEKYAQKLAESGLKVCYLSLYSHMEQKHDWMTMLQGSFGMLNKSIYCLQSAGIEIRFNSVVTQKNLMFFEELIEFAESIGATEVRMLKLIRHGRAFDCWGELGITDEQYRKVIQNMIKRNHKLRITASGATDIVPCRYLYDVSTCPAGKQLIYVTNEGDVFPCASVKKRKKFKIGNIGETDIYTKWYMFQTEMYGEMLCKG